MWLPLPACRFYQKLSGMTGTAKSAAAEFHEIYALRMVPIPTNKPPRRKDLPLRLYYTEKVCRQLPYTPCGPLTAKCDIVSMQHQSVAPCADVQVLWPVTRPPIGIDSLGCLLLTGAVVCCVYRTSLRTLCLLLSRAGRQGGLC